MSRSGEEDKLKFDEDFKSLPPQPSVRQQSRKEGLCMFSIILVTVRSHGNMH